MAERSSLNQVIQIGVESTPGTSVAASKRLQSIGIEPSIDVEMDQFRPSGSKYRAITTLGKEWVTAAISGRGSYTEIVYLLSSVMDTPTITTPGGATLARNWQFISDTYADDVPKTFTVEHGSSVRADKFTYGLVTELGITFNRTAIEVSGSMMGRALTDGITLTAAPTSIAIKPIIPSQVCVYMDNTAAGLGTTKLLRTISAEFNIGSRFAGVYVLDCDNPAFIAHIETEPDLTLSLTLQADAVGMALLTTMRDGDTKFIRIEAHEALGAIEVGHEHRLELDFAGKVSDTAGFSDEDGVYAVSFDFVGVHDATWGKSLEVNVVNTLTAL